MKDTLMLEEPARPAILFIVLYTYVKFQTDMVLFSIMLVLS